MRTVGVAILGVISAAVVMSAALAALIALVEIRDCWHSRRMIRQMTRSGEPKRTVAPRTSRTSGLFG